MRNIDPEVRKGRLERAAKLLLSDSPANRDLWREHILNLSFLPHNEKTEKGESVYFLAHSLLGNLSSIMTHELKEKIPAEPLVQSLENGITLEWHLSNSEGSTVFTILLMNNGSFATSIQGTDYTETHILAKNKGNVYVHKGTVETRNCMSGKRMHFN